MVNLRGVRWFWYLPNRKPLTPINLLTRAGYRTWRRISRARTGRKDCHRPGRRKGSGSGGREQEGGELEGSAVPAIEPGKALDDFGLSPALLRLGEDALQARLGLFEGGQDLATQEGDEGCGQGRGRLPALPTGALLFDRKDHLVIS